MRYPFLFTLIFLQIQLSGQELFRLNGQVKDKENQDLLFGEIFLKTVDSNKVLKLAVIENGAFQFDPLPRGNYLLELHALSYEKLMQQISLNQDLNLDFVMTPSSIALDGITVIDKRPQIRVENGNFIMTVSNTELVNQSDLASALSLIPTVQVSPEGNALSVIGKGSPLIYLDNQRISGEQLASIPVNTILNIELINNPSAKYEAEGRAVVLIRRKKGISDGYQFNLSERTSFRRNFNNYIDLNGSVKKNKFEVRGNIAYNALQPWEGSASNLNLTEQEINFDYFGMSNSNRPQFLGGLGVYYQINERDYLSLNTSLRSHNSKGLIESETLFKEASSLTNALTINRGFDERAFKTINLNYQKSFSAKSALFTGLQATSYFRNLDSEINVNLNESTYQLEQTRDQDFSIQTYALRLDFEQALSEKLKWETGTNLSFGNADAFSQLNFIDLGESTISNYDYKENNLALYTQLNGAFEKITFNIGLRYERNKVEAGFLESDSLLIDRQLTNLFPRLSVNMTLDTNLVLSLNYNQSINRPHFLNATSISTFITPYFEYRRNINLISTIGKEISANLSWRQQSINVAYIQRKNPVFVSILFEEDLDRILSQPINFNSETSYNLSFISPIQTKLWSTTNFFRISLKELADPIGIPLNLKPYFYFYSRHQFRINKTTNIGCVGFVVSNQDQGIIQRKAMGNLSFFFNTRILKKWNLGINFNDVFRTQEFGNEANFNSIYRAETIFTDRREFSIALRYNFGKRFKSKFQNEDVDENIERM